MTDSFENDRRKTPDRRTGYDRREGRDRRRVEDRNNARRLPDEFAQVAGSLEDRVTGLVNRYWGEYPEQDRNGLRKALLPVLEELAEPGRPVTEQHRQRSVEVVVEWAAGLEAAAKD